VLLLSLPQIDLVKGTYSLEERTLPVIEVAYLLDRKLESLKPEVFWLRGTCAFENESRKVA
jgi:hypothetical protein